MNVVPLGLLALVGVQDHLGHEVRLVSKEHGASRGNQALLVHWDLRAKEDPPENVAVQVLQERQACVERRDVLVHEAHQENPENVAVLVPLVNRGTEDLMASEASQDQLVPLVPWDPQERLVSVEHKVNGDSQACLVSWENLDH